MKIALAQINPVIADIDGNKKKIISSIKSARDRGADIIVFPEMSVIGYPPMDLLENKKLIDDNLKAVDEISGHSNEIAVICGCVEYDRENPPLLFNSAAFMFNGKIKSMHHKTQLPTYDVFDELRYFSPARSWDTVNYMDRNLGITICEDIWNEHYYENNAFMENRKYHLDPIMINVEKGADLIINISASPYIKEKNKIKWEMISNAARINSVPVLYVNQVGGNDSLIFDGHSFIMDKDGDFVCMASGFEEDLVIVDLDNMKKTIIDREDVHSEILRAITLGISDYVHKCGFKDVVIGLSGGIDSAMTTCLAVRALGAEHVTAVTMPSIFSSRGSIDDSVRLAENLGIRIENVPITEMFNLLKTSMNGIFSGREEDSTEENMQARIRSIILMAISNKFGSLLLTTGNKSELSMGYCTLYGDMSGALAVIADLPKTLVYRLAEYINKDGEVIPRAIIDKPPSAELRDNQKDEDSLPPYDLLDQILEMYIDMRMSSSEIIDRGYPADIVMNVLKTVNRFEYKRRQAPPGLKVTSKAFGFGRRIPIAKRYNP